MFAEKIKESIRIVISRAREFMGHLLITRREKRARLLIATSCTLFVITFGERLFSWSDHLVELERRESLSTGLAKDYERMARRIVDQRSVLLFSEPIDPGDVRLILHPPGYRSEE